MKLTPLDIQQQQFRATLWGFDRKEVDAFLDLVATGFEDLIHEINGLRDELKRKEASLDEHRAREQTLKETMMTATRIADDVKQGARKEAEIVISQAELQAEQIIQNAHTRLLRVMEDINELKRQKAQFEGSMRAMITAHGKLMDAVAERDHPVELEALNLIRRRGSSGVHEPAKESPKPAESAEPERLPSPPASARSQGGKR
jgi:cell division initiation protein